MRGKWKYWAGQCSYIYLLSNQNPSLKKNDKNKTTLPYNFPKRYMSDLNRNMWKLFPTINYCHKIPFLLFSLSLYPCFSLIYMASHHNFCQVCFKFMPIPEKFALLFLHLRYFRPSPLPHHHHHCNVNSKHLWLRMSFIYPRVITEKIRTQKESPPAPSIPIEDNVTPHQCPNQKRLKKDPL